MLGPTRVRGIGRCGPAVKSDSIPERELPMYSKLSCSLVLVIALSHSARANEVVYNFTTGPIAVGATANVSVPKFDPSLGVLRNVQVDVSASVSGTWGVENTSSGP